VQDMTVLLPSRQWFSFLYHPFCIFNFWITFLCSLRQVGSLLVRKLKNVNMLKCLLKRIGWSHSQSCIYCIYLWYLCTLIHINTCLKVIMHQICDYCIVEHNFFHYKFFRVYCKLVL
jgi:hypothetical protein